MSARSGGMAVNIIDHLHSNYLFAVIRGTSETDAIEISKAAIMGGIKNIEITFTTPNAQVAISGLRSLIKDRDVFVGAGTVMTVENAKLAINSGAEFIVSPHFSLKIAEFCQEQQVPYFPGCATITEICNALDHGIEVVKLFPGCILGPDFIRDVRGPLPDVRLMPSGGVSLENMQLWYQSGAWGIAIGSSSTENIKLGGYESVYRVAKTFVEKYRELLN